MDVAGGWEGLVVRVERRSGSEGRGEAGRSGGEEAVGSSVVVDAVARGAVAGRGACGWVSILGKGGGLLVGWLAVEKGWVGLDWG